MSSNKPQVYLNPDLVMERRYLVREMMARGYNPLQIAKAIKETRPELLPPNYELYGVSIIHKDIQYVKKQLKREIYHGNHKELFEERLLDYIQQQQQIYQLAITEEYRDLKNAIKASENIARALSVPLQGDINITVNQEKEGSNTFVINSNIGQMAAQEFRNAPIDTREQIWAAIEKKYIKELPEAVSDATE